MGKQIPLNGYNIEVRSKSVQDMHQNVDVDLQRNQAYAFRLAQRLVEPKFKISAKNDAFSHHNLTFTSFHDRVRSYRYSGRLEEDAISIFGEY